MKTLFDAQQRVADIFLDAHLAGKNTLDSSDMGTGKTVVAGWLSRELLEFRHIKHVAVICPKAALEHWRRELAEWDIDPLFVLNPEKIRTGNTEWLDKFGKKNMNWQLPEGTLVICDEAHFAQGMFTQNAQLVISLVYQGHKVHMMSATAAEDPTEMRALGFALGLHNLTRTEGSKLSFYRWMEANGCSPNQWNGWEFTNKRKLPFLHANMYESTKPTCARITVEDMPEAFRGNRIIIEPVKFRHLNKINKIYEDLDITPEIVSEYIENGTVEDSEWVLVNLGRARQLAEALKMPEFADETKDLIKQGFSVVNFVNFDESRETLVASLKCRAIYGGDRNRQETIDRFMADKDRSLVVNASAGGASINLHDTHGSHPRVSLISPSFDAKVFKQVTGRIYRNGAKSDAVQRVLIASGTVEEAVMDAVQSKLENLKLLHG